MQETTQDQDRKVLAAYERRLPRYTSYPTAPNFHAGIDAETYRAWLEAVDPSATVSLYLHVPFCRAMCWYCGCHTMVAKSYDPIASYAVLLAREIELVADILPRGLRVSHIHWGGGTPNLLAAADFVRLMEVIDHRFALQPESEIAVELDPRTVDREKIEALARSGVNRASVGIQDVDPRVQEAINRRQSFEMTAAAFDLLREHGIARINADLMYGLPYQTAESIAAGIDRVAALGPDRMALFGYAHVPWMKPHQQRLPAEALPAAMDRLAQYATASAAIVARGYCRIGMDHFARPDDALAKAARSGRLRRNFQGYTTDEAPVLLGFGASAIGSLPQGYVQNAATLDEWRRSVAAGRLATRRGVATGFEDQLRRAVIERLMCDLSVDLARECDKRGVAPSVFASECAAIDRLARDGLCRRDGWRIGVDDRDPPLVRAVCAAFDTYLEPGEARHSPMI
jgi:oxygen-independent coproporphyrinogen-3 oxidase